MQAAFNDGYTLGSCGVPQPANACTKQVSERSRTQSKMKISELQGAWTYISSLTKASVKVIIEGDIVTWPEGHTAKITCEAKKFLLQFEGDSASTQYSAELRKEDGALCWSDNAVWTRVGTPLKCGKFEDVIH